MTLPLTVAKAEAEFAVRCRPVMQRQGCHEGDGRLTSLGST